MEEEEIPPSNDTLRVFCMGRFRVFRGHREVQEDQWGRGKGPTQKIKALFAYLLCTKGQRVRKDTLTDIFWPGQVDPKRADSSLHQALFYLRRALEPDIDNRTGSRYICYHNGHYYFNVEQPLWTDVDAFLSYIDQAQLLEQDKDTVAAIVYWKKAIDLYGGDFMADIDPKYRYFEFYDWSEARCRHLRQLFLTAKMKMAHYYFNEGDCNSAIRNARDVLSIEPAFESAHRTVMKCLVALGEPENALYQYRICKDELALCEDRPPSHRTRLLQRQIAEKTYTQ